MGKEKEKCVAGKRSIYFLAVEYQARETDTKT